MGRAATLLSMLRLALQERLTPPGRARVPEPMVMNDPDGARAFHNSA